MRCSGLYLALLFLMPWLPGQAQPISTVDPPPTEVQLRIHLDSLMAFWPVAKALPETPAPEGIAPSLPEDAQLQARIQDLGGELRFQLTERVRHFIRLYAQDRRRETEAVLGMMEVWLPSIRTELQRQNLPLALQYLPAVLSAANPLATSPRGKSGLWQLPYHAALRQGLECGPLIDERRDPEMATPAALRHLAQLHALYPDWAVAITAFAAGPGNITRARLRTGQDADLDALYPHLPADSRDYWPALIAMNYVARYHQSLALRPLPIAWNPHPVKAEVSQPVRVSDVAKVLPIGSAELRAMNLSLRSDAVCRKGENGVICVPRNLLGTFEAHKSQLYAQAEVRQEPTEPEVEVRPDPPAPKPAPEPVIPKNRTAITYTIQPGDNLGAIASEHGVRVGDLQAWNGIRGTMIRAGDRLQVYVKKDYVPPAKTPPKAKVEAPKKTSDDQKYTVRSGDTLWDIAQRYPGVRPEDIMEANDISEAIQPGQVIRIPAAK